MRVAQIFRGVPGESRILGVHASCIATLFSGDMRTGRLQVVIAVDFSVCADAAISDWLAVLLPRTSVIDLVHVMELAADASFEGRTLATSPSMLAWTTAELDKRLGILRELGFPCAAQMLRGSPDRQLIQFVCDRGADLLVMGARGRGESPSALGSIAASVLRSGPCPILFVPIVRRTPL
jgi:nucleotide-binding universal stress UspA family protein